MLIFECTVAKFSLAGVMGHSHCNKAISPVQDQNKVLILIEYFLMIMRH